MGTPIHIGNMIRRKLDERGMSYAEFARRINCERQSLYYMFSCQSIDIDRLMLISKVLDFDFIRNVYLNDNYCESADAPVRRKFIDLTADELTGIDEIVIRIYPKNTTG